MKKMKQLTAAFILISLIAFFVSFASADKAIYPTLYMPILFESEIPEDIDLVSQAVCHLTEEKIGASLQIVPLLRLFGWDQASVVDQTRVIELELLEKQGLLFDLLPNGFQDVNLLELSSLLATFGKETATVIGDDLLEYLRKDGNLFYLPSVADYVASCGVALRKDIVEKYRIDISEINSFEDLDALFSFVSANEPDLKMICPNQTRLTLMGRLRLYDEIPDSICTVSDTLTDQVINYYATDDYRNYTALFRKWYLAGYLPDMMALQNIRAPQLVKAGNLFSYMCAYKPGMEYEASIDSGYEMVVISLKEPMVTQRSLSNSKWAIAASSQNPGKAMMALNLLYTDAELVNLLLYGIEGIHYIWNDCGAIQYPENIDITTVGYRNTLPWVMPNQRLAYTFKGADPNLWQKTDEYNRAAKVISSLGFTLDLSTVASLNDKLNAIVSQYSYGLETGQIDPDIYLNQMLAEMEAAGAKSLIIEVQKQYDEYLMEDRNLK